MRLVCPNCSAQYEIDGSMIPDEGRDVQCSNCGHTWFELPGPSGVETVLDADPDLSDDDPDQDEFDNPPSYDMDDDGFEEEYEAPSTTRRETRPENLSRAEFEDDDDRSEDDGLWSDDPDESEEDDADDEPEQDATSAAIRAVTAAASDAEEDADDDGEPVAIAATGPRRPADAAALDILREEAERELSQRRAPPSEPLETQTDLGLQDIRNRRTPSRALRARMAHLGEDMPEQEPELDRKVSEPAPSRDQDDVYEEPRRDLLPDIDEINSTLKSAQAGTRNAEAVQRSGFRAGFLLMLFLTIAAIFAYAQAPAIARALPNSESVMIAYVDWANGVRDWVDGLIGN